LVRFIYSLKVLINHLNPVSAVLNSRVPTTALTVLALIKPKPILRVIHIHYLFEFKSCIEYKQTQLQVLYLT